MRAIRISTMAGTALAVTMLAGCGASSSGKNNAGAAPAGSSSQQSASSTASPTATASPLNCPSSPPPASPAPEGDALRAYLPSCNSLAFPSGWSPDYRMTSGPGYYPVAPRLPSESCDQVANADDFGITSDYTLAVATDVVDAPTPAGASSQDAPTVKVQAASYHPGDAAKVLAEIRDYAHRCPSYMVTTSSPGVSVSTLNVSAAAIPGLGDESIDLKATAPGANSLGPSMEAIIVRFGDRILFASCTTKSGAPPALQDLVTPLAKIMKG